MLTLFIILFYFFCWFTISQETEQWSIFKEETKTYKESLLHVRLMPSIYYINKYIKFIIFREIKTSWEKRRHFNSNITFLLFIWSPSSSVQQTLPRFWLFSYQFVDQMINSSWILKQWLILSRYLLQHITHHIKVQWTSH